MTGEGGGEQICVFMISPRLYCEACRGQAGSRETNWEAIAAVRWGMGGGMSQTRAEETAVEVNG